MITVNNNETALVSICCITFNQAPYLRECLDGFIMQQTTFPIEVLIYDDASTDGAQDIIREYENKYPDIIKPIYQTENQYSKGVRVSIVYNFLRAQGKYIALCEGDDYWTDPFKLQKHADFLEANQKYSVVYSRSRCYFQTDEEFRGTFGDGKNTFDEILLCNPISTPASMFRKEIFLDYLRNIEPQNYQWKMGDYPMWLYFAQKSKLYFMDEIMTVYRMLDNSACHSTSFDRKVAFMKSCDDVCDFFADKYPTNAKNRLGERQITEMFEVACIFKKTEVQDEYYQKAVELNKHYSTMKLRMIVTLGRTPVLYLLALRLFRFMRKQKRNFIKE